MTVDKITPAELRMTFEELIAHLKRKWAARKAKQTTMDFDGVD